MRDPSEDPVADDEPDRSEDVADDRRSDDSGQADDVVQDEQSDAPVSHALLRVDPGLAPGLYVVSTPIGNLRDITLRALDVLASVDLVCAEDTRVTRRLLAAHGVSARLRPYHDHNAAQARPALLAMLQDGARIALVSDAGTPLVSDPGYKLVREALDSGVRVHPVPGPTAAAAALTAVGLPSDRFLFVGFLPSRGSARRAELMALAGVRASLIAYEGPSRLAECLADMASVLGASREAAVARELTKRFEEVRRGPLGELAQAYAQAEPPRGEVVVVVGPPSEQDAETPGIDAIDAAIGAEDPARPLKIVAAEIAARLGVKRREVYARMLILRAGAGSGSSDEA
jgi:16S rRNA (cytidine1402-2'-O)-methyltransferase